MHSVMNTQKLNYKTIGTGPALILIHGWGFSRVIWEPIIKLLSQQYKVTIIDLPGYGENKFPASYQPIDTILKQLVDITPPQAAYLGWSLGGLINLAFALHYPQKVTKLIFTGSAPRLIKDSNWAGMSITMVKQFAQSLELDLKNNWVRFIVAQIRDNLPIALSNMLKNQILQNGVPDKTALLTGLQFLINSDYRKQLASINCPQLYLFGEMDATTPASLAKSIQQIDKRAQTQVINNAGHMAFLSHSQHFLNAINQFL